jgi:hypothetical protein
MLKFFYNGIKDSSGQLYKAWYSTGRLIGHVEGTITIYAKNYGGFSVEISQHFNIENDTDSQTDYFDVDIIRVIPSHPLYHAVLEAAQKQEDRNAKRYGKAA